MSIFAKLREKDKELAELSKLSKVDALLSPNNQARSSEFNSDSIKKSNSKFETPNEICDDETWLETDRNHNASTKFQQDTEVWDTKVTTVPPNALVWAPMYHFKGGNTLMFARICDQNEALTQAVPWPLPDGIVLVEFICLPKKFTDGGRILLIEAKDIRSFNSSPTAKTSKKKDVNESMEDTSNHWNEERSHNVYEVLKRKFNHHIAMSIYEKMRNRADEFLKLSLAEYQGDDAATTYHDNLFSPSPDHVASEGMYPSSEKNTTSHEDIRNPSDDINIFALDLIHETTALPTTGTATATTTPATTPHQPYSLQVGDWIRYHHIQFVNNIIITKIIGFNAHDDRIPLKLENEDILRLKSNILIEKLSIDPSTGGYDEKKPGIQRLLDDFIFKKTKKIITPSRSAIKKPVINRWIQTNWINHGSDPLVKSNKKEIMTPNRKPKRKISLTIPSTDPTKKSMKIEKDIKSENISKNVENRLQILRKRTFS